MQATIYAVFCLSALCAHAGGARILALNTAPYTSHQLFYRPLWKELLRRGHELVLVTLLPDEHNTHENFHQIDVSASMSYRPTVRPTRDYNAQVEAYYRALIMFVDYQLNVTAVRRLVHDTPHAHFDLIIAEFFVVPLFVLRDRFRCPLVAVSSMDIVNFMHDIVGTPSHELLYSYLTEIYMQPTFSQRCTVFINGCRKFFVREYREEIDAVVRKHLGADVRPTRTVLQETDLFIINTNVVLQSVRPLPPAMVEFGAGMMLTDPQPLPEEFQTYLDNSKHGVVYFSLGTHVLSSALSKDIISIFLNVFSQLSYDVLWKFEDETLLLGYAGKNLKIVKWAPQQDILRHKNVRLFITQGGVHSLEEAIVFEKPMLVMPFIVDQHATALRIEELRLGRRLDITTLTQAQLSAAIEAVIADPVIPLNLRKYSRILLDAPMKPAEKAAWWIEYVMRHNGTRHLHAPTLPTWQLYYVDVIAFFCAVSSLLIVIAAKLFSIAKNCLSHTSKSKKN